MAKFNFISKRGNILPLIGNKYFDLIDLEGQTSANIDISSITTGGVDGDAITGEQAQPRTLILNLNIKSGIKVEEAKREILNVVKIKQSGSLLWEQEKRKIKIDGFVESVEMPRWNNSVAMQISLHCSQPFWEDIENVIQEINEFVNLHYFTDSRTDMLYFPEQGIPFGIYDTTRSKTFTNAGDVAVGVEIEIIALQTVTNPIIYDTDGNFFGVGYGSGNKKVVMNAGDRIIITTHKGNKTVKLNGESLFDKIVPYSQWLQIQTGDNQFRIDSDDENISNMVFNLTFKQRYI